MLGNIPSKSLILSTVLCTGEEARLGQGRGLLTMMAGRWQGQASEPEA